MALWMSKVWLTEALARKRGANEQATTPNDIGSKPNLFSTLRRENGEKGLDVGTLDVERWTLRLSRLKVNGFLQL